MSKSLLPRVLVPLCALVFVACEPEPDGIPVLGITASPRTLPEGGGLTTIKVETKDEAQAAGAGEVQLEVSAGVFDNGEQTVKLSLADGKASVDYTCLQAEDPKCAGPIKVTGEWNGVSGSVTVLIGGTVVVPADGGADGGPQPNNPTDGGNKDGGSDAGSPDGGGTGMSDAGTVQLRLAASRNPFFYRVGDSSLITATLTLADGGALASQDLDFSTNLGELTVDGGVGAVSVSSVTGSDGKARVTLRDTSAFGAATVSVTNPSSGAMASLNVEIANILSVSHMSTKCGANACTIMGLKNSGFNEQAQMTFKVLDSSSRPVNGVSVTFQLVDAPSGTTVSPSAVTDSKGEVVANVVAGALPGAFTLKAIVIAGEIEVESPTVGVRAAKASNKGFTMDCTPSNVTVLIGENPATPESVIGNQTVSCRIQLVDRAGNKVGGTAVNFLSEAGNIPNQVTTKAYIPGGDNSGEGSGTVNLLTGVATLPRDLPPLAANPSQYPYPLAAEPSRASGQLIRNPRDGLVSIIAYVKGEEYFEDNNSNGYRDDGADGGIVENFIDQGEPFVDENDDNIWNAGENKLDDNPINGVWDGPNGVWDSSLTIWTETKILYSGRPLGSTIVLDPAPFSSTCTVVSMSPVGGLPVGSSAVFVDAWYPDANINRPQAAMTSFSIGHSSSRGAVKWESGGLLDAYGFDFERRLVDANTLGACNPSTPRCVWKSLFGQWTSGYVGWASITPPTTAGMTPCSFDTVSITATVLGVGTVSATTGWYQ